MLFFFRGKTPFIHGSKNMFFGAMHDLLHAFARSVRSQIQNTYLIFAEEIERELIPLFSGFQNKLNDGEHLAYLDLRTSL